MQCILAKPMLGHSPILLDGEGVMSGRTPFKFETTWLKLERFKELLKSWRMELDLRGSYCFILASKLKELKEIEGVEQSSF